MPDVFIIGGPNGAGKTTSSLITLPRFLHIDEFVNADEIAKGINPLKPETANITAGKVMLQRIDQLIAQGKNFSFETTCSGRHHVQTLKKCQQQGYRINLIFYWLPSSDMAIDRVALRVRQGGHNIEQDTIRRRYKSGLRNLIELYLPMSDTAIIIDNSLDYRDIIAKKTTAGDLKILNSDKWASITTPES